MLKEGLNRARSAPSGSAVVLRRAVSGLLVLASLVAAVVLHVRHPGALVTLLPSTDMRELHVDFDTFWHSAVALVAGGDIYETPAKLTNLNPPLLTVLLVPLAWLDPLTAYRVFGRVSPLIRTSRPDTSTVMSRTAGST